MSANEILRPSGNYRALRSFQKAEVIYDLTFRFCTRFLRRDDRTVDQMVQAARSGKQNIVEASQASRTSPQTELRLLNVARASFEELLADYEDFLRVRRGSRWPKDSLEAVYVRKLASAPGAGYETFSVFTETRTGDVVANIALCLIHQANYLLDRQIEQAARALKVEPTLQQRIARARRSPQS